VDAGAAVDGILLRVFTGVAVAERVSALGSTFVLMLAVAAAGALDAADPAGATGVVDVDAAGPVDVGIAEAAARVGRSDSFGGGIAMAIAPLFSSAVNEVEFPIKAAIEAPRLSQRLTSPGQRLLIAAVSARAART